MNRTAYFMLAVVVSFSMGWISRGMAERYDVVMPRIEPVKQAPVVQEYPDLPEGAINDLRSR